jgi:hypothetical protein
LRGKPGLEERRVEEVTRGIPGELAPGAIGTVSSGGQSDYEDASMWVAKAWDRFPPVCLVLKNSALFVRNPLPPVDQPWAPFTRQ